MKPHRRFARYLFSLTLLALPAGLSGQDVETLRDRWKIQMPSGIPAITSVGGIAPGTNVGSASAFGVAWGQGYVGVGYQERARFVDEDDAGLAVGIGLGDPGLIALEVGLASSSTIRSMPFESGFLNLKLHRAFANQFAVAVGMESVANWGDGDAEQTVYGVVTKVFGLGGRFPFNKVVASLGAGDGRFYFSDADGDGRHDLDTDGEPEDGIGIFGALSFQVADQVSLIADWNGQDLGIGTSIAPFQNFPLIVTPAVVDVTERSGDGARFIVGIGAGFEFGDWFNR